MMTKLKFSSCIKPPAALQPFSSSLLNKSSSYNYSCSSTYKPLLRPRFFPLCYVSQSLRPISGVKTNDVVDDGCDLKHWLIVMDSPKTPMTRDDLIASYVRTLTTVLGSEQYARMKIYSVSTRHYYAFGAFISQELSYKLGAVENVRMVLPDSYMDADTKDYGVFSGPAVFSGLAGEPFINGEAVPYDPKYHKYWTGGETVMEDDLLWLTANRKKHVESQSKDIEKLGVKRKTKKEKKDPNKPKRPATAFFIFMESFRVEFKENYPGTANQSFTAIAKAGGEEWRMMSQAEKASYVAQAQQRKKDYEKKMQIYEKGQAGSDDEGSDESKSEVHDVVGSKEDEDDD